MVVNGWTLYAHPLFKNQCLNLKVQVEALREKDPLNYKKKNVTKRLAAIQRLAFELIPHDPTHANFRQGNALGDDNKHWFRAKVIAYAWVNDETNKRAYGNTSDA